MFNPGTGYTKKDIYRILSVPASSQKGAWDTGYRKYNNSIYIFCNIGVPGRTGHDHDNHWEGTDLVWHARTISNIEQPLIKNMLDPDYPVHIFTRTNNGDPFTYQGIGKVKSSSGQNPVQIIWKLSNPDLINVDTAWKILLRNAREYKKSGEIYFSPKQAHEYSIIKATSEYVIIKRLSIESQTEERLTFAIFKECINRINTSGGIIPKGEMYDKVAFEATVVWFLPMLDWDDEIKHIIIFDPNEASEKSVYVNEASDDTEIKKMSRQLRIRRGQTKLRDNLLKLYNFKCCITGTSVKEILHACHILSHSESGNNSSTNALLLRSDIHDLFDSALLGINPETLTVKIKESLSGTEYAKLDGLRIKQRRDSKLPNKEALEKKWGLFIKKTTY